ncbi:MAG: hypothetical protein SGARI_004826, partial [Bacillariaceae sp.]
LVDEGNVPEYLEKIGVFLVDNGVYKIGNDEYNMCELANKIRCAEDLFALAAEDNAKPSRHKPLTEKQVLAERLWAIQEPSRLVGFPETDEVLEMKSKKEERRLVSKVRNVEYAPVQEVQNTSISVEQVGAYTNVGEAEDDFFTPASKTPSSTPGKVADQEKLSSGDADEHELQGDPMELSGSQEIEQEAFKEQIGELQEDDVANEDVVEAEEGKSSGGSESRVEETNEATCPADDSEKEEEYFEGDAKQEARASTYMEWTDQLVGGEESSSPPFDAQSPGDSLLRFAPFTQPEEGEEEDKEEENPYDFMNRDIFRSVKSSSRKLKRYGRQTDESQQQEEGSPSMGDGTPPDGSRPHDNASAVNSFGSRTLF